MRSCAVTLICRTSAVWTGDHDGSRHHPRWLLAAIGVILRCGAGALIDIRLWMAFLVQKGRWADVDSRTPHGFAMPP